MARNVSTEEVCKMLRAGDPAAFDYVNAERKDKYEDFLRAVADSGDVEFVAKFLQSTKPTREELCYFWGYYAGLNEKWQMAWYARELFFDIVGDMAHKEKEFGRAADRYWGSSGKGRIQVELGDLVNQTAAYFLDEYLWRRSFMDKPHWYVYAFWAWVILERAKGDLVEARYYPLGQIPDDQCPKSVAKELNFLIRDAREVLENEPAR